MEKIDVNGIVNAPQNHTLLHEAVILNKFEIFLMLLEHGGKYKLILFFFEKIFVVVKLKNRIDLVILWGLCSVLIFHPGHHK